MPANLYSNLSTSHAPSHIGRSCEQCHCWICADAEAEEDEDDYDVDSEDEAAGSRSMHPSPMRLETPDGFMCEPVASPSTTSSSGGQQKTAADLAQVSASFTVLVPSAAQAGTVATRACSFPHAAIAVPGSTRTRDRQILQLLISRMPIRGDNTCATMHCCRARHSQKLQYSLP